MIKTDKTFAEVKVKSPNNTLRGGYVPDMICCRQTFSRMSDCLAAYTKKNDRAAHYAVAADGKIYNFADIKYAARNAVSEADTKAVSLNRIIRDRGVSPDLYTVYIEFERRKSGALTPQAYESGLALMRYVIDLCRKRYGVPFPVTREHIIGHYESCPVSFPYSPGLDFPLNELVRDLREEDGERIVKRIGKADVAAPSLSVYL